MRAAEQASERAERNGTTSVATDADENAAYNPEYAEHLASQAGANMMPRDAGDRDETEAMRDAANLGEDTDPKMTRRSIADCMQLSP